MAHRVSISKVILFLLFSLSTFHHAVLANEDNMFEQANIAFKDNRYNEAIIHLKNLTNKEPDNLAARLLMAEVLIAFGKGVTAEVELNLAEDLGADRKRTLLMFAEAYLLQGKYHEVIEHLGVFEPAQDEILAAKVFVLRGHAQLGLRQLKLSKNNYHQALIENASSVDAKLGLAQVALNYYRYDEAKTYVDDVLKGYFPPIKAWVLLASIHQNLAQFEQALKAINNALLDNPRHVQALILRASLYIEWLEYDNAKKDIATVFELVPNEPKAQFLTALMDSKEDENLNTKQQYSKLSETLSRLDGDTLKNNPSYYYLAGVVAFEQNNYAAAEQYINNYLEIDRLNIKVMSFYATIHLAMKNYVAANAVLTEANLLEENNAKVLSLLGLVSSELKQYEKAKYYYQKVMKLIPESAIASQQLAKNSIALGDYQRAIDILLAINASSEYQSTISFLLVQAYVKFGKMDKALSIAEKLVQKEPENKEFLHHLGFIYQIVGNQVKAKQLFEKALQLDPLHTKSIISLAETLQATGELETSFKFLEQALVAQENNKELLNALGKNYANAGQYNQSVTWFEKAYRLDNNNKDLLKALSFSYMSMGNPIEAIEVIQSYLTNHEKTADLYILLAKYYQQQGNLSKAKQNYDDAIKYQADKGEVYFLMAQLYQAFNEHNNAIDTYTKSVAWSVNKQKPLIAVIQLLNQHQKPLEGIKLVEQFLSRDSYSIRLQMVLAHAYYLSGQFKLAETQYKSLLSLSSPNTRDNDNNVVGLSLVYQAQRENDKATKLLVGSLKKSPNSFLINSSLAEIYINKSQWQKAYDIYLSLLRINPQQAVLLNNAAFVALNLALYDDAKMFSLASLDIAKEHPDSLDTLGWIYYKTQEFGKALPLFRQALALDSSKLEIKYHLALTLKALDREKEAFNTLVEVVNSKRYFSEKNLAQKLLNVWANELKIKKKL